ncbi:MAG: hypothetical protein AAF598_13465 [Bacteroidota bacterium]
MKNYKVWLIVDITMQVLLIVAIFLPVVFRNCGILAEYRLESGFMIYMLLGAWQYFFSLAVFFASRRTLRKQYVTATTWLLAAAMGTFVLAMLPPLRGFAAIGLYGMLLIPPFFALSNFIHALRAFLQLKEIKHDLPEHTETIFV